MLVCGFSMTAEVPPLGNMKGHGLTRGRILGEDRSGRHVVKRAGCQFLQCTSVQRGPEENWQRSSSNQHGRGKSHESSGGRNLKLEAGPNVLELHQRHSAPFFGEGLLAGQTPPSGLGPELGDRRDGAISRPGEEHGPIIQTRQHRI